jgi:hypothetical protein
LHGIFDEVLEELLRAVLLDSLAEEWPCGRKPSFPDRAIH